MMRGETKANLERLIALVQARRNALEEEVGPYTDADWRWHEKLRDGTEKILRDLQIDEGARWSVSPPDGHRMTLAGVSTSCTSGLFGLLGNWIRAAERRIAKEGGE